MANDDKRPFQDRVRARIHEDFEPIYPPLKMEWITTITTDGPNMQTLEHDHFAPTFREAWNRAPMFHLALRLRARGIDGPWHSSTIGSHCCVKVPVLVKKSERLDDDRFHLEGYVNVSPGDSVDKHIQFLHYSVQNRRSQVKMLRPLYMHLLELWVQGVLEIA